MKRSCLAVLLAIALAGCTTPTEPNPQPSSNQTTIVDVTVNTGPGSGTPTTPGTGGVCIIDRMRNSFFGIGCPSGISPRNGEGVLPMGCVGNSTATPKKRDGSDANVAEHGTGIVWAVTGGPDRINLVEVSEAFNRNVIPKAVGEAQTSATLTAAPGCGHIVGLHNFTVVAASSSAVRAAALGDELHYYRNVAGDDEPPVWRYEGLWRVGDPWPGWEERQKAKAMEGPLPPTPPPAAPGGRR